MFAVFTNKQFVHSRMYGTCIPETDTEPFATSYERTEAEDGPVYGAAMLAAVVLCLALVVAADLLSLSRSLRLLMFNLSLSDKSPFAKNGASKSNAGQSERTRYLTYYYGNAVVTAKAKTGGARIAHFARDPNWMKFRLRIR